MQQTPRQNFPPDIAFDTRSQALRVMHRLVAEQPAEMAWFSADYDAWPLQRLQFIELLQHWALRAPARADALRLLACDWSRVQSRAARFVALRRDFSHRLECRQVSERQAQGLREMLWTPHAALYAHTATWMRGEMVRDPTRLRALKLQFDQAWQESAPAFPANTLGL
jgi:hypothetical protein